MFRSARVLILAVVVAVSLLGSASVASADTIRISITTPVVAPTITVRLPQFRPLDISWE